jgi:hypothetical protein
LALYTGEGISDKCKRKEGEGPEGEGIWGAARKPLGPGAPGISKDKSFVRKKAAIDIFEIFLRLERMK